MENVMNMIDEADAPDGYRAIPALPGRRGFYGCVFLPLDGGSRCLQYEVHCTPSCRNDLRSMIFEKDTSHD